MAVLQRLNLLPNERFDTPDARSLEAFALNDWCLFLTGVMSRNAVILQGFEISNYSQIFTTPGFKIKVSDTVLFQPDSGTQAAGFYTFAGTEADQTVALSPNANNFVEATLSVSSGSSDVRAFWDQGANNNNGGEFTDNVDTVVNLSITITSNITGFSSGHLPLYKVTTNSLGVVTAVTDCRELFFRLGTGGTTPDPTHDYSWYNTPDAAHARLETPVTSTSFTSANAPFQGADKNILSMKEWMDAVMSELKAIKGVPYWYMPFPLAGGIAGAYMNAVNIAFSGGTWTHVTLGHLELASGSNVIRLGRDNNLTLLPFTDVDLSTNRTLYVLFPNADVPVSYGMGEDGSSPIVPKDITVLASSTLTVSLGGNYKASGGNIMIRDQSFSYTSYTSGTGVFTGVSPDPSTFAQVGDIVYQLDSSNIGYYHTSAQSEVPGVIGNVSAGAERVLWLAYFDGSVDIHLRNADLQVGESIEVGDSISLNILTYIGSPSEASIAPNYATTASGALTGQTNYNTNAGEDLTTRASRLTSMIADKAQDKTIKVSRRNLQNIINTTSGSDQVLTFDGMSPLIDVLMPSSASNGTISLTGSLTLAAGEAAYYTVNRNTSFSVVNLNALTVAPIASVPLGENTFIFAYRTTTQRVYLYDNRSFLPGSYPAEPELQSQVQQRLGVNEQGYNLYTSTTVISPGDDYSQAISKLDAAVGQLIADTQIEEEVVSTLGQTSFSFSTLNFSPSNGDYDLTLTRNGRKLIQDSSGFNTKGFIKTSMNMVSVSSPARTGDSYVGRMERQINIAVPDQPYWVNYVTGLSGAAVPTGGNEYNVGTDKLNVFLNGVALFKSLSLGAPADRYQEAGANAVLLGANAVPSDFVQLINEDVPPVAKQYVTGYVGSVLSVPMYTMGDNSLLIFRNGVIMNTAGVGTSTDQYSETTTTTITVASPSTSTDIWIFWVLGAAPNYRSDVTGLTGTTLTVPTYTLGDKHLFVFRSGIMMVNSMSVGFPVDRYLEVNPTSVSLATAATAPEWWTYLYL